MCVFPGVRAGKGPFKRCVCMAACSPAGLGYEIQFGLWDARNLSGKEVMGRCDGAPLCNAGGLSSSFFVSAGPKWCLCLAGVCWPLSSVWACWVSALGAWLGVSLEFTVVPASHQMVLNICSWSVVHHLAQPCSQIKVTQKIARLAYSYFLIAQKVCLWELYLK